MVGPWRRRPTAKTFSRQTFLLLLLLSFCLHFLDCVDLLTTSPRACYDVRPELICCVHPTYCSSAFDDDPASSYFTSSLLSNFVFLLLLLLLVAPQ